MPRKKVVQTDNMTLTSELPDDAIKDITGEDIEPDSKPKTLSQQQSLALSQVPEDKPSKKDIFEEPKTVVPIEDKIVIDCFNFLKSHRITANYGSNGSAHTCVLTDINGNSVMPIDELRNKPTVAYGDDKNRALINAVNSYKSTLKTEYAAGETVELRYEQPPMPAQISVPFIQPIAPFVPPEGRWPTQEQIDISSAKQILETPPETVILNALKQLIRQEIKAQMKDKEDIKSQIMDLVKKLENL